jgi:hypothetical protein
MRIDARTKGAQTVQTWANSHDLPCLTVLRESQAYVRSIEDGLTIFDLPGQRGSDGSSLSGHRSLHWVDAVAAARAAQSLATHRRLDRAIGRAGAEHAQESRQLLPNPSAQRPEPVRPAPPSSPMTRLLDALPIPALPAAHTLDDVALGQGTVVRPAAAATARPASVPNERAPASCAASAHPTAGACCMPCPENPHAVLTLRQWGNGSGKPVMVERIHFVIAGPRRPDPQRLERRYTPGQRRPQSSPRTAHESTASGRSSASSPRGGAPAMKPATLWTKPHAARIDHQRAAWQHGGRIEHEHIALLRRHR